jgi:hypothetical protein
VSVLGRAVEGWELAKADFFWAKTTPEPTTGCLLWTGGLDRDGYAKFALSIPRVNAQIHIKATQFAFLLGHGRWPTMSLLHSCDMPACVEVRHVREGSQHENIRDCILRDRFSNAILTVAQVTKIRSEFKRGRGAIGRMQSLAVRYGVSYGTICNLVYGKTWRHLL